MDRMLTAQEVADHYRISLRTLYRLVQRGEIPAVRIGNLIRFAPETLPKPEPQSDEAA